MRTWWRASEVVLGQGRECEGWQEGGTGEKDLGEVALGRGGEGVGCLPTPQS